MAANILVVDDEQSMREFLAILLEREGYAVQQSENATSALTVLQACPFDLVISDVNMPGLNGMQLLEEIKKKSPETAVLMITAFTTAEQAVEAMKRGAYDYIAKPFKVEEVKVLVKNALEKSHLQKENRRLKEVVQERYSFSGLIGKSKKMRDIYDLIEKVSVSMANVLILGESGTGKELVAKAIHYNSPRREKRFVAVNCGAIPETLMEAELFGHKKGSFTGAVADRPGLFEQAEGGTLFLDEIGEVPLQLQAKLLRVLQEREFRRVGGVASIKADVRVIAASNKNLEEQAQEGTFREDLFYRLNVVPIHMPSLRERVEDIPYLAEHFYKKVTGYDGAGPVILSEAMNVLINYSFPGNVRELENLIERCVILGGKPITLESLPPQVLNCNRASVSESLEELSDEGINLEAYLDAIEKRFLLRALAKSKGVKKNAASLLGMTFRSFRYRLAKFGMEEE
ncbi:sigma-54-dependent transcriptional regulator [Geotalea toluenoxydans]|uniref:sigma-54-dependent transcriptional regulator n=1 Tax=Geotalea toluenoxydans TaxID=421624 RepID=UPI0006CFE39D|nr:sigma-54 dependent transcriptional regulator [Geotalea toluenoxydans]